MLENPKALSTKVQARGALQNSKNLKDIVMGNQQETDRFITILAESPEAIRGHSIQLFVLNNRQSNFICKYKKYIILNLFLFMVYSLMHGVVIK